MTENEILEEPNFQGIIGKRDTQRRHRRKIQSHIRKTGVSWGPKQKPSRVNLGERLSTVNNMTERSRKPIGVGHPRHELQQCARVRKGIEAAEVKLILNLARP